MSDAGRVEASPAARNDEGGESSDSMVLRKGKKDKKKKKDKKERKEKKDKKERKRGGDSERKSPKKRRRKAATPEEEEEETDAAPEGSKEVDKEGDEEKKKKEEEEKYVEPENVGERDTVRIPEGATHSLGLTGIRSGLPAKYLSTDEQQMFRGIRTDTDVRKFLYTRNATLALWERQPTHRLYLSTLRDLTDPANVVSAHSIFTYLEQFGYINYGWLKQEYKPTLNGQSVVVIGAGISGLLTAHQLKREGFKVTVYDAGPIGGRCRDQQLVKTVKKKTLDAVFDDIIRQDPKEEGAEGAADGEGGTAEDDDDYVPVMHPAEPSSAPAKPKAAKGEEESSEDAEGTQDEGGKRDDEVVVKVPMGVSNRFHASLVQLTREKPAKGTEGEEDTVSLRSNREELVSIHDPIDRLADLSAPPSQAPSREGSNAPSQESQVSVTSQDRPELNREPIPHACAVMMSLLKQAGVPDEWWFDRDGLPNEKSEAHSHFFDSDGQEIVKDEEFGQELDRAKQELTHYVHQANGLSGCSTFLEGQSKAFEIIASRYELDGHAKMDKLNPDIASRDQELDTNRLPITWGEVCENLARGLDVRTYHPITKVVCEKEGLVECTMNEMKQDDNGEYVLDPVEKKEKANHCVVTVPIGVLKKKKGQTGYIDFTPPIPKEKARAIEAIGVGVRNVLLIEFSEAFWLEGNTPDLEGESSVDLILSKSATGTSDDDIRGIGVQCLLDVNPPRAIFSLSGEAGLLAEEAGEALERLVHLALTSLQRVFKNVDVFSKKTMHRASRWGNEPHIGCSAPFCVAGLRAERDKQEKEGNDKSNDDDVTDDEAVFQEWDKKRYGEDDRLNPTTDKEVLKQRDEARKPERDKMKEDLRVGTRKKDFYNMGTPLPSSTIFFAGDATDFAFYGRLEGAVNSAFRVASEVLEKHVQLKAVGTVPRTALTAKERVKLLRMSGILKVAGKAEHAHDGKPDATATANPDIQLSRGSSRNLAEKYRKVEAVPTLQQNLFNAAIQSTGDTTIDKSGYVNRAAALQRARGQQGLKKLEKQTENQWRESRHAKRRELAQQVVGQPEEVLPAKKKARVAPLGETVQQYKHCNAVDDLLPTWYYQRLDAPQERQKEFATNFYTNPRHRKNQLAKEAEETYRRSLESVVAEVLTTFSLPEKAYEHNNQIRIFSKSTLKRQLHRLTNEIITKFRAWFEKRNNKAFTDEWARLPDPTNKDVRASVWRTVVRIVKVFVDPEKEKVIDELGHDPNDLLEDRRRQEREREEAVKQEMLEEEGPESVAPSHLVKKEIDADVSNSDVTRVKAETIDVDEEPVEAPVKIELDGSEVVSSVRFSVPVKAEPKVEPKLEPKAEILPDEAASIGSSVQFVTTMPVPSEVAQPAPSVPASETGGGAVPAAAEAATPAAAVVVEEEALPQPVPEVPGSAAAPGPADGESGIGSAAASPLGEYTSAPYEEDYSIPPETYTPDVKK